MQLRQPKALCTFDHHNGRIGDIHPHFNHRGGNQNTQLALLKCGHGRVLLLRWHLPVHQPNDTVPKPRAQGLEAFISSGKIHTLTLLHQGADPIGLFPVSHSALKVLNHLIHTLRVDKSGLDRLPPSWLLIKHRNIHIAILRQSEAARDRCRSHHKHICAHPLLAQLQPLTHAKPVLLIHNRQPQIGKMHILLKDSMSSNKNVNLTTGQRRQLLGPRAPLVPPCQKLKPHTRRRRQRLQALQMLPRQNLGGRHHNALPARLDSYKQSHQGHKRFARTHIPLQQAVHSCRLRHILGNLAHSTALRARWLKWKTFQYLSAQNAIARAHPPLALAAVHPRQGQGKLMRKKFVIRQTLPRRGRRS